MQNSRNNVLVVDDQPLLARGLVSLLRDEIGVNVFQSTGRFETLPGEMGDYQPSLVIVGITADLAQARERVALVRGLDRSCRIAVVAPPNAQLEPVDLVRLEISSVISRSANLDEVVVAVRQVLAGRVAIDSATASRLLNDLSKTLSQSEPEVRGSNLTRRELQVLELVADGLPNRDVANQLHISENTVKNHMRSIHEKLDVRTRTEAVVKAARHGLLGLR